MSRSAGATCVTSRSLIEIVPEVTDSRPAIMFNKVDLPQPEGPTNTKNSPFSMPMLMSLSTGASE